MRYIQIGEKTVAIYSEHYRERNQNKNQGRCFKRCKNNRSNEQRYYTLLWKLGSILKLGTRAEFGPVLFTDMYSFRRPCINKQSKQNVTTNEVNKNTANKFSSVNHQEPSTNPSRTPLEVFVEAIRNLQKIMAEDINFTSR